MNNTREQNRPAGDAVYHARTPFLAALGAGDLAAHAVVDTMHRVREQVQEQAGSARAGVNELPHELNELRGKLDPDALRRTLDNWTHSATELYGYLAGRGEDTLGKLRTAPPVQRAWSQVDSARERFDGAVGEAREFADDMLGRVATTSRSVGEKAARRADDVSDEAARTVRESADSAARATTETADDVARNVSEAGTQAAATTRSTSRKAAGSADSAKTETAKTTGGTKNESHGSVAQNGNSHNGSGQATRRKAADKQPKSATRKATDN